MNASLMTFPRARFDQMLAAARAHDAANASKDVKWRFDTSGAMDAAESAFFARQLEFIRPGVLEVLYPDLKGALLVPIDTSVDPGAANYVYQVFSQVGEALVTATLNTRAPRVDVFGSENSTPIRSVIAAYGYSIQEARGAMLARTPLIPRRAMTCRDIIERKLDTILFIGDPLGLSGLLNQSNTNTYTAITKDAGGTTWNTATPDEIVADLNGAVNKIVSDSLEIEQPDTVLLPLSAYTLISSKRMGDGDSTTILQHFLKNSPYIKSVEATHKSETIGSGTSRRMVTYRRDPNKLSGIMPQPFEQLPPQTEGFEVVTNCHARTAGVVVFYPKSIAYTDGI